MRSGSVVVNTYDKSSCGFAGELLLSVIYWVREKNRVILKAFASVDLSGRIKGLLSMTKIAHKSRKNRDSQN